MINLNKETKNKIKNIIFVVSGILVIIVLFLIIILWPKNKNSKFTSSKDFNSIKQAVEFFGCEYYDFEETSNDFFEVSLGFKVELYNEKVSYENYYNNLINVVANVLDYYSFELNDDKKNVYISVKCDPDDKTIQNIIINDEENFFQNLNSKMNLNNYTKVNNIQVNVQSSVLTSLIRSDWDYNTNLFGTKESMFDNYEIFFNEGLRARNVNDKVFNLVFTNKYNLPIINNLSVGDSFEEVKNILGEPTFEDDFVIGYKTEKFYIFFLENQVSVYRVENFDTSEFTTIISKFVNQKNASNLVSELTNIWPDFDYIHNDSNMINLLYTLKGVNIQFNYVLKHGIHIYTNFSGNITENISINSLIENPEKLPENIFIESDDLVYKAELQRARSYNNIDYFYPNFKFLVEETEAILKNGGNIYDAIKSSDDNGKFIYYREDNFYEDSISYIISIDDENPSSELEFDIFSYIWISQDLLVYSIKGNGIYLYNAIDFTTQELIKGDDSYEIKSYNNGILEYDYTEIEINL